MFNRRITPKGSDRFASIANAIIAGSQGIASVVTGNPGFAVEALHNTGDAFSFEAKRRAKSKDVSAAVARRYRHAGAAALTLGGLFGIGGCVANQVRERFEDAGPGALGFAVGATIVNAVIAYTAHRASDDSEHAHDHGGAMIDGHDSEHSVESHQSGSHSDSRVHAIGDAASGTLYTAGLMLEHRVPGSASYAMALAGALYFGLGLRTHHHVETTHGAIGLANRELPDVG